MTEVEYTETEVEYTETEAQSLDQLDGAGLEAGSLVMFDLRSDVSWQDRITVRDVIHAGRHIRIYGC